MNKEELTDELNAIDFRLKSIADSLWRMELHKQASVINYSRGNLEAVKEFLERNESGAV